MAGGAFLLSFMIIYFLIIIGIVVAFFLFTGFGLKGMAESLGIENSWLGFIPVGNTYLIGKIAEHNPACNGKKWGRILIILNCVVLCLSVLIWSFLIGAGIFATNNGFEDIDENAVSNVSAILSLAFIFSLFSVFILAIVTAVCEYICYYRIFQMFSAGNEVVFLLLAIFISASKPIILFCLRHNRPVLQNKSF